VRISATVRHEPSRRSTDFVWEVEPDTTLAAIVEHAAGSLGVAPTGPQHVHVDGEPADPRRTMEEGVLTDGAVISFGAPPSVPRLPDDLPTVRIVGGPGAGTVFVVDPGVVVIGRRDGSTVVLDDPLAPPVAAALTLDGTGRFSIAPALAAEGGSLASTEGDGATVEESDGLESVYVDRCRITASTELDESSIVQIGATLLAVSGAGSARAATSPTDGGGFVDYARPPRLLPDDPPTVFRYPPEPQPPARRPLPIVAAIAPLVMAVVMARLFDSLGFLAFGLMSPVVLIGNYLSDRRNGRTSHRRRLAEHEATKAAIADDASAAVRQIEAQRRLSAPDPAAVLDIAIRRRSRLWERRRDHADHLSLRVGTADVPSGVTVEDPAELEHRRLVSLPARDVPVSVALGEHGVVGLAGRPEDTRALSTWFVAQLGVLQSPRDVEVVVLTTPEGRECWSWLRWVPHARTDAGGDRAIRLAVESARVARRLADLGKLVDARRRAVRERRGDEVVTGPDVVVVIDGARRLRTLPGLVPLLRDGPAVGVRSVCLDADPRALPEECLAVVTCSPTGHTVAVDRAPVVERVRPDHLPAGWADAVARGLAPLIDVGEEDDAAGLPARSRLLDVLDLTGPTPEAVRARWEARGPTTEVVIGQGIDGPFSFDLRTDGPHALVAGTTGSGKSELLQSMVASLAVANTPDSMTFVLVDYKGGAAFRDLAALPHTVGMVTDLDPHLVERALDSLGAELLRREHLLAAAGAKDIEDYLDAPAAATSRIVLPRLVIVIDEFASLARELPDFVTGLVNIAQRGRSLGVHLVLATQRPTGVVTGDIRANTNLRIALRVTDDGESTDVIDARDAAGISKSTPGRAFARLGAGALLPFQAGRVGGRAPGGSGATRRPLWGAVVDPSSIGHPLPTPPEEARVDRVDETDLVQLVAAVAAAALQLRRPAPHRPWLDALPDALTLDEIPPPRSAAPTSDGALVPFVFALEDHPTSQSRRPGVFDVAVDGHLYVVGAPRTGRSQVLRSVAASIATTSAVADVHVYGLDCGSGALLPLTDLPHVGAVVQRTEVERAARLLTRLVEECHRRQEVLAAGGHSGVVEQRDAAGGAGRLPHVVLMIDRWEGFAGGLGDLDGGKLTDQVMLLLREGASAGIHLIITGDRQLVAGRFSTLVDRKIVLRLSDASDYSLAGLDQRRMPDRMPEGRAVEAATGVELQIALIGPDASGQAQSADLQRIGADATARETGVPLANRPFRLDRLEGPLDYRDAVGRRRHGGAGHDGDAMFALIGVGGDDLEAVGPDLRTGSGTFMIGGPSRSGRSTALMSVVRSLVDDGVEVVAVAPRPSPLRGLLPGHGVLAVVSGARPREDELSPWFDTALPRRVLVVDDAELLRDGPAAAWLSRFVMTCSDRGQGVVVAGASTELATGFSGWLVDVRRNRCGAVLSPQTAVEGDVIGAALPKSSLSGRLRPGVAVVNLGSGELLQVRVPFG
jgi:S-DNA-T family DNA segregation ATPase FtsK/SpoIIIE